MYRDRRRRRALRGLAVGRVTTLVPLTVPAPAFACLPYEAASNFSFRDGLNLAVVGNVLSVLDVGQQPHKPVIVDVDEIIAGADPVCSTLGGA